MSSFTSTTLAAESRRLRATRTTAGAVAAVFALTALLAAANVLLAGKQQNGPLTATTLDQLIRAPGQILGFVMLLVGVLSAAGEYRHGTVVGTFLAEPRRTRVVVAKAIAIARVGAGLALATAAVAAAVGVPLLMANDAPDQHLWDLPAAVAGLIGVSAGYGVIGVALGLVLRNQAAALTVALVWQFVVESILPVVLRSPGMVKGMPGGAADSLLHLGRTASDGMLPPWQGGLVFAAYAVGLLALAAVVRVPQDHA